jgi:hypothetical protein
MTYLMDWQGWATFGFVATLALTAIVSLAQMFGWSRMDLPMMLGTVFVADPDRARALGIGIHIFNGQVFALFYASAFGLIGHASPWLGVAFGVAHGFLATAVLIPTLQGFHPRMATERAGPELTARLEPPGPLALNYGLQTPLITLFAHAVYGLILGSFLAPR